MSALLSSQPFGRTSQGEDVKLYTLRNSRGVEVRLSNYGGIIVSFLAPDREGHLEDIVLGYDQLDGYLRKTPFFGCLVGRYANRIAGARFTLDGQEYRLAENNPPNTLHGGVRGFDKVTWEPTVLDGTGTPILRLRYLSRDGEEGYPGNLAVTADHTLTEENGLRIELSATTDRPTVVNLTQHSYFNLAGAGDVLGHVLQIFGSRFTPINRHFIPLGELRAVAGTPFDFRTPTAIGARIHADDEQLRHGLGYDHNWVIDKPAGELARHARVVEPRTGRTLELLSSSPGMQFYAGNFLDGTITGKGGRVYLHRHGFCLEPQHFPDSPNQPQFPSVVLRPGETYRHTLVYRVGVA
ncbi:MAG: galactose mutarotase [Verrucomicrobia bacterium]|nr:galactose mutarotase [Verrucomicrobiota bacterium]